MIQGLLRLRLAMTGLERDCFVAPLLAMTGHNGFYFVNRLLGASASPRNDGRDMVCFAVMFFMATALSRNYIL